MKIKYQAILASPNGVALHDMPSSHVEQNTYTNESSSFSDFQVPPDRHLSLYAYLPRSPLRPDTRQAAPYQSRRPDHFWTEPMSRPNV